MPKLVDHHKRKIQIAEATWDVIVNEGMEQASVRKIAKTAGLSVGALRHYFSTQSELLHFSMELVSERIKERIEAKEYNGDPMEFVTEVISEVLPVDEERKIETEVWFVFSAKTLVDSTLQDLSNTVYNELRDGMKNVIQSLQQLELARDDLDLEMEACRLHALVDGMAMHHLLHPDRFTYEDMLHTLRSHLQSLCR